MCMLEELVMEHVARAAKKRMTLKQTVSFSANFIMLIAVITIFEDRYPSVSQRGLFILGRSFLWMREMRSAIFAIRTR